MGFRAWVCVVQGYRRSFGRVFIGCIGTAGINYNEGNLATSSGKSAKPLNP